MDIEESALPEIPESDLGDIAAAGSGQGSLSDTACVGVIAQLFEVIAGLRNKDYWELSKKEISILRFEVRGSGKDHCSNLKIHCGIEFSLILVIVVICGYKFAENLSLM
ncbi:hypothetical protein HNV12_07295 [Methanococcoides sp. SA1]|nr:hypothetical protein [Methanococcoides sp. SA1]